MPDNPAGALRVLTRPRMLLLHAAGILAVATAGGLGLWQVDAWQEHREDRSAEMAQLDPVPLGDVLGPDDPFPRSGVGRPVAATGEWVTDATVLVDRRLHEDRLGAWMVTPLAVCESSADCADPPAVPVVVGWVPSVDEAPEPPTGTVEMTGWLQPAESEGEADPDPDDDVLTAIRIADLLQRVDQDLYGAYVILDQPAEAREGLVPVTPDSFPDPPAFTGLRNLLYGLEWWVFAGFAAYLWFQWSRDAVRSARAREAAGATSQDQPIASGT